MRHSILLSLLTGLTRRRRDAKGEKPFFAAPREPRSASENEQTLHVWGGCDTSGRQGSFNRRADESAGVFMESAGPRSTTKKTNPVDSSAPIRQTCRGAVCTAPQNYVKIHDAILSH